MQNFFGTYGLAAIAHFLQTQANTNIMSTPNLVTLDNEEAKIIVGRTCRSSPASSPRPAARATNPFQTIERKDVGITLRIKPQIGENGTIRMTIFQETSSLAADTAPGTSNAGPTTNKRSIESNVIVDDGQIMVLGGLIEDRYTDNKSKVPLLGDIPYIGALFRTETRDRKRTNLMVFLRPMVMRDAETSNKLSVDRYDLIRASSRTQQPRPSVLVPINEAPVVPPLPRLEDSVVPISRRRARPARRGRARRRPSPPPRRRIPRPRRRAAGLRARRLNAMGARHPLPYAYAKAHTLLLEDDGARLVLWAPETRRPAGALRGAAPVRRRQLRARVGRDPGRPHRRRLRRRRIERRGGDRRGRERGRPVAA